MQEIGIVQKANFKEDAFLEHFRNFGNVFYVKILSYFQDFIPLFASISHNVRRHLFVGRKTIFSHINIDSFLFCKIG